MAAYALLEVRRLLRNPPFLLYSIGFPLGIYLLFTTAFGGSSAGGTFASHYMVSMALYATMATGLTGIGARIAFERSRGWTRQLALTPLRPWSYLAIKVAATTLLTVPVIVLVLLAGGAVNGVRLPAADWAALVPILWFASLPFTLLGVAIAYTVRDEAANGIAVGLLFVFSLAGGLWMPAQFFPPWLLHVAQVLPSYRGGQLGWRLVDGLRPLSGGAVVFAAWLVGAAALAGWRFRRGA